MGNLLEYSGITTKIRAMKSQLLSEDCYRELAALTSVGEAVAYLKKHPGYQELFKSVDETSLHRGEIEQLIYTTIFSSFTKIYKFSNAHQREYLSLYFKRYEITILKTCLRSIFDHRNVEPDLSLFKDFFERHSKINVIKVAASATIEEFAANLKETEYYNPLNRLNNISHPTLFDYEMALDLYYFSNIWRNKSKVLSKEDLRIITKDQGSKCDILNIMWILRAQKYYNMSAADVYALLIPVNYKLSKSEIFALVEAGTEDEFLTAISTTYYGKRYTRRGRDINIDSLDDMYRTIRNNFHRKDSKNYPYSIATINSYLYNKENEVDKITTVLEGIRYKIPPSQILEYIIK